MSPDPDSRTKDHGGRRIEEIDGGWRLLNHAKYKAIRDEEAIKESKRKYINKRREKERVEKVELGRANAEADSDAEAEAYTDKEGEGSPCCATHEGELTASERITFDNSLKRIESRLKDLKEANLPDFVLERKELKEEKQRLLKLLQLRA